MAAKYTEIDWYDTPLYYDIIFDTDTTMEADFLEAARERYCTARNPGRGKSKGRVLEPACGSGRLVVELAKRGWEVCGVDLNQAMLDYARNRLPAKLRPRVKLKAADMAEFRVPGRYDLAHCLVSSFKYLASESAARSHLRSVAAALKIGGIYVLGLHLSEYEDQRRSREKWSGERDGVQVHCVIEGWPPNRRQRKEAVRSRLRVTQPDGSKLQNETNWTFRTYDDRQLGRLLKSVPELEPVAVHDFSYDFDRVHTLDDEQLDTLLILRRRY